VNLAGLKSTIRQALVGTAAQGRFDKVSVRLWDNWARIDHNVVHAFHHLLCRQRYLAESRANGAEDTRVGELAGRLRQDGYCVLPDAVEPALLAEVAERARALLADPAACWRPTGMESFITHVKDSARAAPQILKLLSPEIAGILTAAFRSHFKIYYTEIYRTHPTSEKEKVSWLWHSDNHPGAILKIMIYLNDVSAATGAFRAHPWSTTRSLLRRGFRDRNQAERFAADLESDRSTKVMEGRAGTAVLFDNNLIHKATAPLSGYRDVVVFEVIPSLVPWDRHVQGALDRIGTNQAYPPNPFRV
jgi:hypothetical protein